MNKKYVKLFLVMMIAFFASISSASAKQFKKIDELGTYINEWVTTQSGSDAKYDKDSLDNVIVIGTHVFTNFYDFKSLKVIQDASRTIDDELPSYYYQFTMKIETDDNGNITSQTWDFENPGDAYETDIDIDSLSFLNIKYIDEKPIYDNKVNPTESMNEFVGTLTSYEKQLKESSADYYHAKMNGNNIDIILEKGNKYTAAKTLAEAFENDNNEDYSLDDLFIAALKAAYEDSEENYQNVVVKYGDTEILNTTLASIFDVLGENKSSVEGYTQFFGDLNSKFSDTIDDVEDLAGKSLTITFNVKTEDEDQNDLDIYVDGTNTFTVNFYKYAEANNYFNGNGASSNAVKTVCEGDDKACTLVMNLLKSSENLNTLDRFKAIVKNALDADEVSKVILNLNRNNKIHTYEFTSIAIDSLDNQFTNIFKEIYGTAGNLKVSNLADLNKSTITFNFDATKVKDKYNENLTSETYTFNIGEYVDTDSIVDAIAYSMNNSAIGSTPVTNANEYYHLDRIGDKLTLDAKIVMGNGGKFYRFETVTDGLAKIIYDNQSYSVINSDSNTSIESIIIIDNEKQEQYTLMSSTEAGQNLTLRKILSNILDVNDITSSNVMPTELKKLNISIKFVIKNDCKLMPGIVATDAGAKSATYDITFNVDDFTFANMMTQMFNNNSTYFANVTPAATENVYNIELNLNSVGTSLEDAKLFDKLEWYAGLFSTIKVTVGNVTETLDLTDLSVAEAKIASMLGLSDSDNVSALKNKEITFEFTVADDVNNYTVDTSTWTPNTSKKSETYTVKVKFTYTEASVGENDSIATTLQTTGLDVINLAEDADYSGNLTINSSNKNIEINGKGATIIGDVTIANGADNVVINDLNITGKLIVQGNNLIINGTKENDKLENTIKGSIDVKNNNSVSIDSMKIEGTKDSLVSRSVIDAMGTGTLTLTNSEIKYINDGTGVTANGSVYSLLHLNGNSVITGNTFDIRGVKNPIEYNVNTSSANDVIISNNEFKGSNYIEQDAHNIISFYGAANNATITIDNNHFEYANWAVRVSDYSTSNNVTYIITNNIVDHIKLDENEERNDAAFMGLQNSTNHNALTRITIKYDNNKIAEQDYLVEKIYKHSEVENLEGTPLVVTRNGSNEGVDVEATGITFVEYSTEATE